MWSFASNAIACIGMKKGSIAPSTPCSECSDDEVGSVASREELECPICWESFNIVENVPYVLWCGHTLCKNCVLGLQWAVLKFPTQQIKIPFLICCPWCHLLSFRLVYNGQMKFPRKNFFLLWMVESLNGDRVKFGSSSSGGDNQAIWSPKSNLALGNQASNANLRRASNNYSLGLSGSTGDNGSNISMERHQFSLQKSLDCFIQFTSKFPLVIIFLLVVFFAIPGCVIVLALYMLITVLFAIPSLLVLYFTYPMLRKLVREITS